MKPIEKKTLSLALVVVLVLAAVPTYNLVAVRLENPLLVAYEHAVARSGPDVELATLGGGYSTHFLARRAYGHYRAASGENVFVEVAKPTPLHAWHVVQYQRGDEADEAARAQVR